MSSFKTLAKKLAANHEAASEKAGSLGGAGGGGFDAGRQRAWLVSGKVVLSEQLGNWQIEWTLIGADEDNAGVQHRFWTNIEPSKGSEQTFEDCHAYLEKALITLEAEYDADSFVSEEALQSMVNNLIANEILVQIQVKEKNGYLNTYINKKLDASEEEELEDEPDWSEFAGEKKRKKGGKKTSKDDDDEPAAKPKGGKKSKDDEPEEVDLTYEVVMELKQKELIQIITDNELKVNKKSPLPQLRKSICKVLELEPADDDDDADDEPAPKGKAGKASSKSGKKSSKDDDDDDDEIEVGDLVFGLHDGETIQGKVTEIDGKTCTVKPKKGKAYEGVKLTKVEKATTPFDD